MVRTYEKERSGVCKEKDTGDEGAGKKEKGKAEEEVVGCGGGGYGVWVFWRRMWLAEGCGGRRRAVATPNRESQKEKKKKEERYQGRWDVRIMADYFWSIECDSPQVEHSRKSYKRKFLP